MTLPVHAQVDNFEVIDNCLCVGGRKITDIADELDSTPFYAYDKQLIENRLHALKKQLPAAVDLHYAIKANPMPAVVNFVSNHVDGLDVASGLELEIALQSSCTNDTISFAGPGKTQDELQMAISAGITLNVESQTELDRIATIAESSGTSAKVAIRVNPDFELKGSGMKMSGGPKPFGIDADKVPEILIELETLPITFVGFHIFSGSQNLNANSICESQRKSVELAIQLAKHAPAIPRTLNIGGGFGIPYFPGDKQLEVSPICENLESLTDECEKALPGCILTLELGRYLVGTAGIYVCRIVDKKISRGQIFLVTNGGLHHHLAASGNFGQVIRKNYPVLIGNRLRSDAIENVSIVGPLCTPLDILADRMDLPAAEIGDYVVVFQSGAYGFTASPHRFLGHPPAKEILL